VCYMHCSLQRNKVCFDLWTCVFFWFSSRWMEGWGRVLQSDGVWRLKFHGNSKYWESNFLRLLSSSTIFFKSICCNLNSSIQLSCSFFIFWGLHVKCFYFLLYFFGWSLHACLEGSNVHDLVCLFILLQACVQGWNLQNILFFCLQGLWVMTNQIFNLQKCLIQPFVFKP
jgi:hypothetical protein